MSALELHEASSLLRTMSGTESALLAAMASELVLRHGDVAAGLVDALNRIAGDRAKVAA